MAAHSGAMATRRRTRRPALTVGLRTNGPTSTRPETSLGWPAAARTAEPAAMELPTMTAGPPSSEIRAAISSAVCSSP
jgi:hypothetical protein